MDMERDNQSKISGIGEAERYKEGIAIIGYPVLKCLLGPVIRKIWVNDVEGLENIPEKGPAIIAANHESYFDFLCFLAVSPRKVHYLAAEKFFENPLWKPLVHLTGQIKVDRRQHDKTRAFDLVCSALSQGRLIGIFPEGTRSPDGKLLRGYTGVAKFALKANVPVIPVGITGTYDIMSRHDRFPRFNRKARIKIGKPLHFEGFNEKIHNPDHFRDVTDTIMQQIARLAGKEYRY